MPRDKSNHDDKSNHNGYSKMLLKVLKEDLINGET